MGQFELFNIEKRESVKPLKSQLLKWIGNKQRFAHEIISYFPNKINRYFEPFLGSGAVLASFAHNQGIASDSFKPLIEIWQCLSNNPDLLKEWYRERWEFYWSKTDRKTAYEIIKEKYNNNPNAADLLFLSRSCYGGVVRFRKADGYMSTPCGVHKPIKPDSFNSRVDIWYKRTKNITFMHCDYKEAFSLAEGGDLIYCDPPYSYTIWCSIF